MIITVDLTADRPLYLQIADGVRRALVAGTLAPGDRLPPGREMAASLGVNLETVQRAYRRLAKDGMVTARVGRGTRVADDVNVAELGIVGLVDDLVAEAHRLGLGPERLVALIAARFEAGD